jgi:hypothetical protein
MTQPRSFTSLHRAGRSARPKLRSLERNKKDVAPRTRRHVRAVRHGFGFHSRDVREKTRKLGRCVASPATATTDFFAPDILDKCDRAVPAAWRGLGSTLLPNAEGPPSFDGPRQRSHHLDARHHDGHRPSINAAKCPRVVNGSLTGSEHHRSRSEGTLRRHRSNHDASSSRRDRAPASSARPSPSPALAPQHREAARHHRAIGGTRIRASVSGQAAASNRQRTAAPSRRHHHGAGQATDRGRHRVITARIAIRASCYDAGGCAGAGGGHATDLQPTLQAHSL